jgi:hypothetical protein
MHTPNYIQICHGKRSKKQKEGFFFTSELDVN